MLAAPAVFAYTRRSNIDKTVAGASAAARVLLENAPVHQVQNVTLGRILRADGELRPFGRGQLALEAIQHPVEHLDLAAVERLGRKPLPETRLEEHGRQSLPCARRPAGRLVSRLPGQLRRVMGSARAGPRVAVGVATGSPREGGQTFTLPSPTRTLTEKGCTTVARRSSSSL